MLEQIDEGTILLDVEGKRVGVINGLVVYNFSRYSFGKPARITTQVRMGSGEFLNIEREIEMSGPIHTKGVLILQSLLANRFAKEAPLSLNASIVLNSLTAALTVTAPLLRSITVCFRPFPICRFARTLPLPVQLTSLVRSSRLAA